MSTPITLPMKCERSLPVTRAQDGFCWYALPSEETRFGSSMPASPTRTNDAIMKKNHAEAAPAEMREHYDFDYSTSRPNRFASRPKLGRVRSVVLESDVAEV